MAVSAKRLPPHVHDNTNSNSAGHSSGDCLFAWFLRGADMSAVLDQMRRSRRTCCYCRSCHGSDVPVANGSLAVSAGAAWPYTVLLHIRATMIGFAAMALLPARRGDVLRPYLLARSEGFSATSTFATVVWARARSGNRLGLLAIYVLLLGGRETLPRGCCGRFRRQRSRSRGGGGVMGAAWTLATHPERVARLVLRSERVLPGASRTRCRDCGTFSQGFVRRT